MSMTAATIFLRIATGLGFVLVGGAAGYVHRSPLIIPVLAIGFAAAYVAGKQRAWRHSLSTKGWRGTLAQIPSTYVAQVFLVGLLYLIGFGLGALVRGKVDLAAFGRVDVGIAVWTGVIGVAFGLAIDQLEKRKSVTSPDETFTFGDDTDMEAQRADINLLDTPVQPHSLFRSIHYTHDTSDEADGEYDGTPNEKSAGSDAKIAAAEARLGVVFPEGLRAIYRVQNGGSINSVCVLKAGITQTQSYDDVIMPFSGYDDLEPLERVRPLFDAISDYAEPDTQPEEFPEGCKQMMILAQWYRETLFLDYSNPGAPRVGFTDFDNEAPLEKAVWWEDFDAFFASLRHYEDA